MLHGLLPALMKLYDVEPWNYQIFGPQGMDDLAVLTVYLDFGKEYKRRTVIVSLNLAPMKAEIISVRTYQKPKGQKNASS